MGVIVGSGGGAKPATNEPVTPAAGDPFSALKAKYGDGSGRLTSRSIVNAADSNQDGELSKRELAALEKDVEALTHDVSVTKAVLKATAFDPGTGLSLELAKSLDQTFVFVQYPGEPAPPVTVVPAQATLGDQAVRTAPSSGTAVNLGTAMPEDGTLSTSTLEMAYDASDPASMGYLKDMAMVGAAAGFGITVHAFSAEVDRLKTAMANWPSEIQAKVTIVAGAFDGNVWVQDNGEPTTTGKVVLPASFPEGFVQNDLRTAVDKGRGLRGINYAMIRQGQVAQSLQATGKVETAKAAGLEVVQGQTYLEGGNVLTGTLANGDRYALVGRDSAAINQAMLERKLGRPVSEGEVRATMAQDLGVKPENLTLVEQPGEFHLDMRIIPLPDKRVVLNDAMAVFALQADWLRQDHAQQRPAADSPELAQWQRAGERLEQQIAGLKTEAESLAAVEDKTKADLVAAGFAVERMAGTFPAARGGDSDLPEMNFMNAVQMTTPAKGRLNVHLGGDPRAEAHVEPLIRQLTGATNVVFLDRSLTEKTLRLQGGIACRVKMMTGVVQTATSVTAPIVTGAAPAVPNAVPGQLATTGGQRP